MSGDALTRRQATLGLLAAAMSGSLVACSEPEQEILTLVAQGRTNGEIGRQLFISTKTVSVHVSNILAKLGVGGRVEAAGVAHRLGLVPLPPS